MVAFYNQEDQDIYKTNKFMPQSRYLLNAPTPVVEEEEKVTESFGIPQTQAFKNSGGDNFNSSFSNNPYVAQPSGSFVTNRTGYGTTGYLSGTEPKPSKFQPAMNLIKKGIGMAIPGGNFLMGMAGKLDNFKNLSAQDKAFIEMQMGNQEQSMYGGNLANQDRYGYNKRSMFGNYADLVSKRADKAREWQKNNPGKELLDIHSYYLEKEKEEKDVKGQIDFNDFARQRGIANKIRAGIKKGTINEGFNIHTDPPGTPPGGGGGGGGDGTFGIGSDGQKSYSNPGDSFGTNATTGGPVSNKTGRGRTDYMKGGRTGYFFGGRVSFKNGGLASIL
jgi:hypothetical protein